MLFPVLLLLPSLHVTLWALTGILNLFPVAWVVARMGPGYELLGEPLNLFCNFAAKVGFSDLCIVHA
jgi:hypothetical protein